MSQPPLNSEAPTSSRCAHATIKDRWQLAACVAEFRITSGVAAQFIVADPTALALQPVAQTQILHIVREALTNIRRHAQAHHVQVHMDRSEGMATLVMEDDGRGFDPQAGMGDHHMGLMIMRRPSGLDRLEA